MAENVMSFANENIPRGVPALHKSVSSTATNSPAKRAHAFSVKDNQEARPPLAVRSKPKQPYLKRGTGLQSRLTAAKHKRYVPKGGFIKGQVEEEVSQLQSPSKTATSSRVKDRVQTIPQQKLQHDLPQESFAHLGPAMSRSSIAEQQVLSEAIHSLPGRNFSQSHDQPSHGFGTAQFYANADTEAELDADTALVHFPHEPHYAEGKQPSRSQKLPDETVPAQQVSEANQGFQHLLRVAAERNEPNSLAEQHMPPHVLDWQVQQAAEVFHCFDVTAAKQAACQTFQHSSKHDTWMLFALRLWNWRSSEPWSGRLHRIVDQSEVL